MPKRKSTKKTTPKQMVSAEVKKDKAPLGEKTAENGIMEEAEETAEKVLPGKDAKVTTDKKASGKVSSSKEAPEKGADDEEYLEKASDKKASAKKNADKKDLDKDAPEGEDEEKSKKKSSKSASDKKKSALPVKTNKWPLVLALLLIVAAVAVYFVFGLVPSTDHMTYKRYTAAIPEEFDMETLPALSEAVNEVAGVPVNVNVATNVISGKSMLELIVVPSDDIDEQAVVTMLADDYEEMGIESLNSATFAPAFSAQRLITCAVLYGVILLALFILCSFIFDGKSAFVVLLSVLLATLMAIALYVICRVPTLRMLIVAVTMICVAVPYLSIVKLRALWDIRLNMKKPSSPGAVAEYNTKTSVANVDLLVVGALLGAAFAAIGIIKDLLPIAHFGIMLFVAVGCTVYVTSLITPVLWAGLHKK